MQNNGSFFIKKALNKVWSTLASSIIVAFVSQKQINHPLFCKWLEEKKLSSSELSILKQLSEEQALPLLDWIGAHSPSHSQGVEILELSGELLLMDKLPRAVFQALQEPKALLKKLRGLRYPLTLGEDEKKFQYIKTLPWSKQLKGQWIRKNDKSGLHITFTVFSLKDFHGKIKSLETLYNQLKKEGVLWKN